MKIGWRIAIGLALMAAVLKAETFKCELQGLCGPYRSPFGISKSHVFQLPRAPVNVSEARILIAGNFVPGTICGLGDLSAQGCASDFGISASAGGCSTLTTTKFIISLGPTTNNDGAWVITKTYPSAGLFVLDQAMPWITSTGADPNWAFLNDGTDSINVSLYALLPLCGTIQTMPDLEIWHAVLIISESPHLAGPDEGEYVPAGVNYKLSWIDAREGEHSYQLYYSVNSGTSWNPISSGSITGTSYYWAVPAITSDKCLVKIADAENPDINDVTSQFYIYQCTEEITGDLDHNCYVNVRDLAIFAGNWCDSVCMGKSWCNGSDMDFSGVVDFNDLKRMVQNWLSCKNPFDQRCW
jgi:hypothetical protein